MYLLIRKRMLLEALFKKGTKLFLIDIFVPDPFVIGRKFQKQLFVLAKELRRIQLSLVPDQRDMTLRSQNSFELSPRRLRIEPVKRLCGNNKVDRFITQRGLGRGAVDTPKVLELPQRTFGCRTHSGIWLDAVDNVSIFEKWF